MTKKDNDECRRILLATAEEDVKRWVICKFIVTLFINKDDNLIKVRVK